jgi:hypothetical protein
MFEVVDLVQVDNDIKFQSTKRLMYGENIIRVKVKHVFRSPKTLPIVYEKYIYLNDKSFTKMNQPPWLLFTKF